MPMSSGLSAEGHSSSRAPKAPRSRARLRAQQVAENAKTEVAPVEAVQAKSVPPQQVKASVTKAEVPQAEPQPTGAAQTDVTKPTGSVASEASAQPAVAQSAATQSSSSVRHMPRKPVHKASMQKNSESSASKSASEVHSSAQSLKDSVRSALMTGRTVSEVEHAPELFDVEAFEDSSSKRRPPLAKHLPVLLNLTKSLSLRRLKKAPIRRGRRLPKTLAPRAVLVVGVPSVSSSVQRRLRRNASVRAVRLTVSVCVRIRA